MLAVGLLKRGFDVKVFEKNITAIRGEGKYRGPIQVSGSESSLAHNFLLTKQQSIDKPFNPLQVQSNALAALEAIDKDMADKILAEGCITGDRINGLVDGATGKWYRLSACFNCPWLLIDDAALTLRAQCIYLECTNSSERCCCRYVKFDTFHPAVDRGLPVTRVISRVVLQQLLAETAMGMAGEDVILNDQNVIDYQHEASYLPSASCILTPQHPTIIQRVQAVNTRSCCKLLPLLYISYFPSQLYMSFYMI